MIHSVERERALENRTDLGLQQNHHVLQLHILVDLDHEGLSELGDKGELDCVLDSGCKFDRPFSTGYSPNSLFTF